MRYPFYLKPVWGYCRRYNRGTDSMHTTYKIGRFEINKYIKMSDLRVLFFFNHGLRCRIMDFFMNIFTQLGSLVFAVLLPLTLLLSGKDSFVNTGLRIAAVLVCSQTVVFLVKISVHRPRPFKALENIIIRKPTKDLNSFPSGHTCAAFSLAFVLAASIPGLSAIFFALAALVGFSRIYLGVHYPSDVVIGVAAAYLSHLFNTRVFF